ncbi:MAG: hypothetical protein HQK66_06285 [Desulfamplus sp.]|nr:hypothetical protein [Desulfamplus sp.]
MKPNASKKKTKTDWSRLASMTDSEIDCSDIPELNEEFWANATVRMPSKSQISIRVDTDFLDTPV